MSAPAVIDAWVNARIAGHAWQHEVAAGVFGRPQEDIRNYTGDELVALLDAHGVDKAIVGLNGELPEKDILRMAEASPERLALAVQIDPRRGMKALRALADLAKNAQVVALRVLPCLFEKPPDDRMYYPLYAKAIELGLPLCVTVGMPLARLPGRCQDPVALDDVCLFFPELTVVMAHGAEPWWPMAIRLMHKHPNLHLMTSACAPRHLPAELLAFMSGRGADKVMFASDFPFLGLDRAINEARGLEADSRLGPESAAKYLGANAARVFFARAPAP